MSNLAAVGQMIPGRIYCLRGGGYFGLTKTIEFVRAGPKWITVRPVFDDRGWPDHPKLGKECKLLRRGWHGALFVELATSFEEYRRSYNARTPSHTSH